MSRPNEAVALRVGAAALGMFAGMALGLLLGCLTPHLASCVFGAAAAGVITGLCFPEAAMSLAAGTLHFFLGFFSANAGVVIGDGGAPLPQPSPAGPWLRVAFVFGVAYAVALWVLL